MAEIPRQDEPTVRSEPLPTPYLNLPEAGEAGVALGRAAQAVARPLQQLALEEKANHDATRVLIAETQWDKAVTDALHAPDPSPATAGAGSPSEPGFLNRLGLNAIGKGDDVLRSLADARDGIAQTLANETQRRVFLHRTAASLDVTRRQVLAHEADQGMRVRADAFKTRYDTYLNAMIRDAADPVAREIHMAEIVGPVKIEAARIGATEERQTEMLAQAASDGHAAVLSQMLEADPAGAREYYRAHRDAIFDPARGRIGSALREIDARQSAQGKADALWSQAAGDLGTALGLAARISDPELRDGTEDRLRRHAADVRTVQAEREDRDFQAADQAFRPRWDHTAIPAGLWAELPTQKRDYFLREEHWYAAGAPEMTRSGIAEDTWRDWFAYKQLSAAQKVGVDLYSRFRRKVPDSDFMQLVEEQQRYRDALNQPAPSAALTELESRSNQVENAARRAGILPWVGDSDEDQRKSFLGFQSAVSLALNDFERKNLKGERRATGDEAQPIIDRLLIRGEVPQPWYMPNPHYRLYTLSPGQAFVPFGDAGSRHGIEDQDVVVPPFWRRQVEAAIRRDGREPTDAEVTTRYLRFLESGAGGPR
ncbi:MAG: hypothetical protein LAO51_14740 [Acidobacteriia bacterium]|nr:hypothetical protein [Terriglobia bacterium]